MKINLRKAEIQIRRGALDAIYDECDRYDRDETGGRLVGTYELDKKGQISIVVSGVIEPGPSASRTSTSFFQDGEYQENVFRALEARHPDIEHLGNWHTHHVNGYPTLSGGDRQTYHRIVNHQNHNTDFFYALLVTAKNDGARGEQYEVKHFLFGRNQRDDFEIPSDRVRIINEPPIWPGKGERGQVSRPAKTANDELARDSEVLKDLFPDLKPFQSKTLGSVYWRGALQLADETTVELLVAESPSSKTGAYVVAVKKAPEELDKVVEAIGETEFSTARSAAAFAERELNKAIFRLRRGRIDVRA